MLFSAKAIVNIDEKKDKDKEKKKEEKEQLKAEKDEKDKQAAAAAAAATAAAAPRESVSSVASSVTTPPAVEEVLLKDEREDMQEATFRKWVNYYLEKADVAPVDDLFKDLRDGTKLLSLLEILTSQKLPREKGKSKVHSINNINRALEALQENKVRLVNVNSHDIADGNAKITLGLVWSIIQQQWQVALRDDVDVQQVQVPVEDILLQWCKCATKKYEGVSIKSFRSSWRDGLVFNALIHSHRPDLFDFNAVRPLSASERLAHAFKVAEQRLGVWRLLEPEDVNSEHVDKKSIITYVMCLFQVLPHTATLKEALETMSSSPTARADSCSIASPMPRKRTKSETVRAEASSKSPRKIDTVEQYNVCLEEILAWLLSAEERLNVYGFVDTMDVDVLRTRLKEHEELMISLNNNRVVIVNFLQEGRSMAESGKLSHEQIESMSAQMRLISDRWEKLSAAATNLQTQLHAKIGEAQQAAVRSVSEWLSAMEDAIGKALPLGTDPEAVANQALALKEIQEQIEKMQPALNRLSSMVVVREGAADTVGDGGAFQSTLQDVGKRWFSVCQWAEKRAKRLHHLPERLKFLSSEQKHFCDWLDQREAAISTLRAPQGALSSKQVAEQVQNMQAMKQDLEQEHARFRTFTQRGIDVSAVLEVDNPVGGANVRSKVDEVIKRWDNLVTRMDEQALMLTKSAKNTDKLVLMRASFAKMGSVVKKPRTLGVTSKITNGRQSEKKARVGDALSEEFQARLANLLAWLVTVEDELSVNTASLDASAQDTKFAEQIARIEVLEAEAKRLEPDLEVLHTTGFQLVESLRNAQESTEEVERHLANISSKWRDTHLSFAKRKRTLQILLEADDFSTELHHINDVISDLYEWAERFNPESFSDIENVRLAAKQCQGKLEVVKARQHHVEQLQHRLEKLAELQSETGGEKIGAVAKLEEEFAEFTKKWAGVVDGISTAMESMRERLENAPEVGRSQAVDELLDWLATVESMLGVPSLAVFDEANVTAAKLGKLHELSEQFDAYEPSVAVFADEPSTNEVEKARLQQATARFSAAKNTLSSMVNELETGLKQSEQLEMRITILEKWLNELADFIESEDVALGDAETLKAQLDQCQGSLDDMKISEPKLFELNKDIIAFCPKASASFSEYLKQRIHHLNERWKSVAEVSQKRFVQLQGAYQSLTRIGDDLRNILTFLKTVEDGVSTNSQRAPQSGKELQSLTKKYKMLKEEFDQHSGNVEASVKLAREFESSLEAANAPTEKLRNLLANVVHRWDDVRRRVDAKIEMSVKAFEMWREFQELLASQKVCLDELERKLSEPMKLAADAEEFSEQLDLLERLMESHDSDRLVEMGEALMQQNIITEMIRTELERYKMRRSVLKEPALERQKFLEVGAHESQEFEQQLLNCSSWIVHVDYILSSRLDSDILASDVPEEYKRALVAGQLANALAEEFAEHDKAISRFEQQVQIYRSDGREQAANRLEEQVVHLKKQMNDVRQKFSRFQKPGDFDQRFARVRCILNDIDQSIELVKLRSSSASYIEEQIEKSQKMLQTLNDLKSEVDSVLTTGKKMIELEQIDRADAATLTERLNMLRVQFDELLSQVTVCKNTLEMAMEYATKMEKEVEACGQFLGAIAGKLDRWEQDEPTNIQDELNFVQNTQQDLIRHESGFAFIDEQLTRLEALAEPDVLESLGAGVKRLRTQWEEQSDRLHKWQESLQVMVKENSHLEREFHELATEVKGWLDATERQLKAESVELSTAEKQREEIQKMVHEASSLKPALSRLRDKAVELMSKGARYERTVEPDLTAVNTRWESVTQQIKMLQKSFSPVPLSPVASPQSKSPDAPLAEQRRKVDENEEANAKLQLDLETKVANAIKSVSTIEQMLSKTVFSSDEWAETIEAALSAYSEAHPEMYALEREGERLASLDVPQAHELSKALQKLSSVWRTLEQKLKEQREIQESVAKQYALYREEVNSTLSLLENIDEKLESAFEQYTGPEGSYELTISGDVINAQQQTTQLRGKAVELNEQIPAAEPIRDPLISRLDTRWSQLETKWRSFVELTKIGDAEAASLLSYSMSSSGTTVASEETVVKAASEETIGEKEATPTGEAKGTNGGDRVEEAKNVLSGVEFDLVNSSMLCGGDYSNFSQQEDGLKLVRDKLDSVERIIDDVRLRDQAATNVDSLFAYYKAVERTYLDRQKQYAACFDRWETFHRELFMLNAWLDGVEKKLTESRLTNGDLDFEKVVEIQPALERESLQKEAVLRNLSSISDVILPSLSRQDSAVITEKVDAVARRWQSVCVEIAYRKDWLEERYALNSELKDELDDLLFWLDENETETEAIVASSAEATDADTLADLVSRCKQRQDELVQKSVTMVILKEAAQKTLNSPLTPEAIRRSLREELRVADARLLKAEKEIGEKVRMLDEKVVKCMKEREMFDELSAWIKKTKGVLEAYLKATIYTPMQIDPSEIRKSVSEKTPSVEKVLSSLGPSKNVLISEFADEWKALQVMTERAAAAHAAKMVVVKEVTKVEHTSQNGDRPLPSPKQEMHKVATDGAEYGEIKKAKRMKETVTEVTDGGAASTSAQRRKTPELPPRGDGGEQGAELFHREYDVLHGSKTLDNLIVTAQLKELTQLKHWLGEAQREFSGVVDITDLTIVKDALKKQQAFLDQLQTKRLTLIKILETSKEPEVQHKAEVLCREWERCFAHVTHRKRELTQMLEDVRSWDNLKVELEVWFKECDERIAGKRASDCTLEELMRELRGVEYMSPEFDHYKERMKELNQKSNRLIDTYTNDDSTTVSQVVSELNTSWSRLNDNFRVRRAVLEASLRGRKDFQSALSEFVSWLEDVDIRVEKLDAETSNVQSIKDTTSRRQWLDSEKDIRAEVDAHADVRESIETTGRKIIETIQSASDRRECERRLSEMDTLWQSIQERSEIIRRRLETAQEQWEKLTGSLRELIYWVETRERELLLQQPIGGDMAHLSKQSEFVKHLQAEIDAKSAQITDSLKLAESFLIQQDLRAAMRASPPATPEDSTLPPLTTIEKSSRRVAQQIRAESDTLRDRWQKLLETTKKWHSIVKEAVDKMTMFEQVVNECDRALKEAESTRKAWTPVKDLQLDRLQDEMDNAKTFRNNLANIRENVDSVNDHSGRLLAENVHLSRAATDILEDLNSRYKQLETAVLQRVHSLQNALRDFGPSSQHFLSGSVVPPWERAVSVNRVPYYINHETEKTQWDHPKMVSLMDKLCEFNDVKFSAYRTGMKLRAFQKKLCLDLFSLNDAISVFEKQRLRDANEKVLDVTEIVLSLLPVYESVNERYPDLCTSVPVQVDLALNWLLNVYDSARSGSIRVLSLKVAIACLCRAHLEDKYKFLFKQVSVNGTGVDQKKLALLLHDCLQIPKFLGEVAAFGGSNIEPSVRSCFSRVKYPTEVTLENFLDWLKLEPQSVVWLPVMHRIASSETAKHQAKCNVCKMFPIVGLRYRCLKCFNFDMCQSCFFSQRKAKGHKLAHPMQEYCVASTSGEDVRDFAKVVRNKFKSQKQLRRHPRLGYLPVESVVEGEPIESRSSTPSNPATQDMHSRLETYASRLAEVERRQLRAMPGIDETLSDDEHNLIASYCASLGAPDSSFASPVPQSPAQIVTAIDGIQREELETLVRSLEDQNKVLQAEYDRLRSGVATHDGMNGTLTNGSLARKSAGGGTLQGRYQSTGSLQRFSLTMAGSAKPEQEMTDSELLAEAAALRQHKARLEARMQVLEDHNKQLEVQLVRLKHIIDQQPGHDTVGRLASPVQSPVLGTPFITPLPSATSTLQSQRPFQLQTPVTTMNGKGRDWQQLDADGGGASRIGDLMSMAEDLGKAMSSLVNIVTSDDEDATDEHESSP